MVVSNSSKINRRAAQENAAVQEKKLAQSLVEQGRTDAGTIARANAKVEDKFATPTNDLAPGFNPSNITVVNGQFVPTGVQTQFDSKIQQRAMGRLQSSGLSPEDAAQRIKDLLPSVQNTMSNTGLNPADGQSDIIKASGKALPFGGSIQSSQTGANGNLEYILDNGTRVSAAAYDKQMNDTLATIKQENSFGNPIGKITTTTVDTPSTPEPIKPPETPTKTIVDSGQAKAYFDSLSTSLSPEQQTALAPTMAALNASYMANIEAGMNITAALKKAQMDANDSFKTSNDFLSTLLTEGKAAIDSNKEAALAAEKDAQERILRDAKLAREIEKTNEQQMLRDGLIKQHETEEAQLLQNGILSGWRSSKQTASVMAQIRKGENAVQDLRNNMILTEAGYTNKILDIETNYTSNLKTIAQNATNDTLKMLNDLREKAMKLDNDKTSSDNERAVQISKIEADFVKDYGNLQVKKAELITKSIQDMYDAQAEASKQAYKEQSDLLDDTYKYISVFGTGNQAELKRRELLLKLPVGTLSNQKTLSEIKKAGTGGIGGQLGTIPDEIDMMYNIYQSAGLDKTAAQDAVAQTMYNRYGTSNTGREQFYRAQKYINEKYGKENQHYSAAKPQVAEGNINAAAALLGQ